MLEPGSSKAPERSEVESIDPPGSFGHGIAVGCAICAVLVHVGLVALTGDLAGMYRDFGARALPAMTRLTLSVPWQLGVPVVGVALIGALVVRRPRRLAVYVAVAVVLAAAAACTYWFPAAPIHELAGNIRAD
ncbi:MAG TPA: hypothetical protein VFQ65_28100 [Kofleriaceae bacterium]|nr:hypothetical protein [Kofleriaceae bacterium]